MRKLPASSSLFTYLEDLQFTEAALAANQDTADLADSITAKITECDEIIKTERQARHAVVRAEAVVAVRDDGLDTLTQRVAAQVFLEANQDRKSTFYRRFFPIPPSEFTAQNLRKQCQQTLDVLVPEMQKLPDTSALKALANSLAEASQKAVDALDTRGKAMAERGIKSNDVVEWKEGLNRFRTSIFAELLKRAADKGYPKSWADTFFHQQPSNGGGSEPPEPPPSAS